jgi:hypothetical protein
VPYTEDPAPQPPAAPSVDHTDVTTGAAAALGPARRGSKRTRWLVVISGLVGVALFAYAVTHVGRDEMLGGVRRLGWGFLVICALGGLRFMTRALAWMACVDKPLRLGFGRAFEAVLASDALGTLIPAGPLASEPAKVVFVSDRLPVNAAMPSVAIENILYTLSAGLMIAAGAVTLLNTTVLQGPMRVASTAAVATFAILAIILIAAARTARRPVLWMANRAGRFPGGRRVAGLLRSIVDLEDRTLGFAATQPWRWLAVFALEVSFHVLAVIEIWITLFWILPAGTRPTLLGAFVLESTNRLITVMFKFVPLRVGVDEAGSGVVAQVLALGPAAGVTLAIIRKGRTLCWTAVGVLLMLLRGWMTSRELAAESGSRSGAPGL